jgi:hypothetical protein
VSTISTIPGTVSSRAQSRLDWVHNRDLTREQLRDILIAAFAAALLAAQQTDRKIQLHVT